MMLSSPSFMYKISIPRPCFESWENMTPDGGGRYCNACAVTVVDFSVMNDEAVQQYFILHHQQKICGRFKNTQLQRIVIELPKNIFRLQIPFWKKFLVAFLICFGGSFLSIDITIAGNGFTQGTPIVHTSQKINFIKPGKKNHHRKKHKRRHLTAATKIFEFDLNSDMRAGYTTIEHDPEPTFSTVINTCDALTQNEQADTTTTAKNNSSSNYPVKDPAPTIPHSGSAFMLPAITRTGNPFSKKKKVQYV